MRNLLLTIYIFISLIHFGQSNTTFNALNFNTTARISALGGTNVGVFDHDPSTSLLLPSNLTKEQEGSLLMNYVNYFADTDIAILSYIFKINEIGIFSTSLTYCNYGQFDYADPSGDFSGQQFSANDILLQIGHAKRLANNLQVGLNLKFVGSFYEQYNALAFASDLSITYYDKSKDFGSFILLKNLGGPIKKYYQSGIRYRLPFTGELGVNKKLEHAPIRFNLSYKHLEKWDMLSSNTENDNSLENFGRSFFSHLTLGTELLFSDNFHFRFGYNFLNRMNLQPTSRPGTSGISWGTQFKIKKLIIAYTNAKFHMSGTSNHISVIRKIK